MLEVEEAGRLFAQARGLCHLGISVACERGSLPNGRDTIL